MRKDTTKIELQRLDQVFVGTHTSKSSLLESWDETGHYYEGFNLSIAKLRETNGLRQIGTGLGHMITGNGQPAQNKLEDLNFYDTKMSGLRNMAFLIGQKLFLFRLVKKGNIWYDNRISVVTDIDYDNHRLQGTTEISGYVPAYERLLVQNVRVESGRLKYDILSKQFDPLDAYHASSQTSTASGSKSLGK